MPSGNCSQRVVLPSISVMRYVIIPTGRSVAEPRCVGTLTNPSIGKTHLARCEPKTSQFSCEPLWLKHNHLTAAQPQHPQPLLMPQPLVDALPRSANHL